MANKQATQKPLTFAILGCGGRVGCLPNTSSGTPRQPAWLPWLILLPIVAADRPAP